MTASQYPAYDLTTFFIQYHTDASDDLRKAFLAAATLRNGARLEMGEGCFTIKSTWWTVEFDGETPTCYVWRGQPLSVFEPTVEIHRTLVPSVLPVVLDHFEHS